MTLKSFVKRNSHNSFFKNLAGFGRALNRFYENRNHDIYSNGELTIIKKISGLNPKVIIDGGANIGKYSMQLSKYCTDSKIFAFEPVPETFSLLESAMKSHNNVQLFCTGLYSETTSKKINLFPSNTHSSLVEIEGVKHNSTSTVEIKLIKGDEFLTGHKIEKVDFLKLDLEGADYDALLGFNNSLKNRNIRLVQFEFGYINISTKKLLIDFYNLFSEYGYILGKVFPKIVEFREYNLIYEDFLGPNFVAVHKDDSELINLLANK